MEPSAYQVPNFWWYSPGFPKHIMNPFYQRNYRNLGCRLISRCRISILGWKNHIQSCLYPASWLHWIRMTKWTSYWWKTVLPSTKAFGTSGNVSNQNIPFFRRVMLNFSGVARSISMPMKGHPKKKGPHGDFLIRVCWDMAAESASAVSSEPGNAEMNFIGNSLTTRYVYSVMVARLYSVKKNKNGPLIETSGSVRRRTFCSYDYRFSSHHWWP